MQFKHRTRKQVSCFLGMKKEGRERLPRDTEAFGSKEYDNNLDLVRCSEVPHMSKHKIVLYK